MDKVEKANNISFAIIGGMVLLIVIVYSLGYYLSEIEQHRHKEAKMKLVVIHKAIEMDYDPEKLQLMFQRTEE